MLHIDHNYDEQKHEENNNHKSLALSKDAYCNWRYHSEELKNQK